ncbi:MAG: hypothetical protein ACYSTZ_06245 [Planctomycetota bacterium]
MKVDNSIKLICCLCIGFIMLILQSAAFALPPDPDNAALLYYQAFCVYEKPDDSMKDMVGDLAKGKIEPNPTITKYVEGCRPAIKLAASAGALGKCDWGMKYSDGLDAQARYLAETKMLTYIILADARIALLQDDYDLAIQRCLTARKLAIDVGQGPLTIGYLVEKAIEKLTNKCIQEILSANVMDLQTLQQLEDRLDELDRRIKPVEFFLETEQEVMAMYITPERIRDLLPYINPESLPRLVNASDDTRECILNYVRNADEQFCQKNLVYFNNYWSEIFSALKLPYLQAYNELKELGKKYLENYNDCQANPDAIMTILLGPAWDKLYNDGIESETFSNAVKTALEIYKIAVQTGQRPDSLPAGLPKDMFSGKDFEYEKKDDGFVLRCQGKDMEEDKIHEYEFKVKK